VVPKIDRGAEDGEAPARQPEGAIKGGNMLLGTVHPAIRIALGVVVLVIGVTVHKMIFDVAGAAVVLIGAAQWLYRMRRPGARR
jgi:hypothetical protein